MTLFRFVLIFSLIINTYTIVFSETLSSLLTQARQANPEIIAAEYQSQATREKIGVVTELPDPVLMMEFRGMPLDPSDINETKELMIMVQQMFPYPGKLKQAGARITMDVESQQFQTDVLWLTIRAEIQSLYYQLYWLNQALAINAENQALISQLLETVTVKYTAGDASQADILQAQVERSQLKKENLDLNQKRRQLIANLNQLLHRPLDTPIDSVIVSEKLPKLSPTMGELEKLLPDHPRLKIAETNIQATSIDLKIAQLKTKPDFGLMGGYTIMNEMPDVWMGRLTMTLPFMPWSNADNSARINRTLIQKQQQEAEYQAINDQLAYQIQAAVITLKSIGEQIELYRHQLLPEAQQMIEASLASYQTNLIDFSTLINNERQLQTLRLQYFTLISQYYQTWTQLEKAVGRPLV